MWKSLEYVNFTEFGNAGSFHPVDTIFALVVLLYQDLTLGLTFSLLVSNSEHNSQTFLDSSQSRQNARLPSSYSSFSSFYTDILLLLASLMMSTFTSASISMSISSLVCYVEKLHAYKSSGVMVPITMHDSGDPLLTCLIQQRWEVLFFLEFVHIF